MGDTTRRIYLTHCSAKKNESLRATGREVPPDELYTSKRVRRFIRCCQNQQWAIFSDLYGVWFPGTKHRWYEKPPDSVTEAEYRSLLQDFNTKLGSYDEIWFYYNPGRFHPLYKRLLKETSLKDRVRLVTHLTHIQAVVERLPENTPAKSELRSPLPAGESPPVEAPAASAKCKRLHEQLDLVPVVSFPFDVDQLPENGIYFLYERGEVWGHGGDKPRIVRIGTAGRGNFRSRISEHFLLRPKQIEFDAFKPAPKDRSVFRKNLGRALLHRDKDPYSEVWELDFTLRKTRDKYACMRDIVKEKRIEAEVTQLLRETFSFRFLVVETEPQPADLEGTLIGTVAQCPLCRPSQSWLGLHSPDPRIRDSGLWQVQRLKAPPLSHSDQHKLVKAIQETLAWAARLGCYSATLGCA